ncbi:MAG: hypothetical protein LAN62_18625 [Acidobacteriia bacterium]|nr:hypothetical protein [Terriglobia bacterium]
MQRIPPESLIAFEAHDGRVSSGKILSSEVRSGERIYKVKLFPGEDVVEVPADKVKSVTQKSG